MIRAGQTIAVAGVRVECDDEFLMLAWYGKVPGARWPFGSEDLPRRPLCVLDAEQLLSEGFNSAGNPSAYPTSSNSRQLRAPATTPRHYPVRLSAAVFVGLGGPAPGLGKNGLSFDRLDDVCSAPKSVVKHVPSASRKRTCKRTAEDACWRQKHGVASSSLH